MYVKNVCIFPISKGWTVSDIINRYLRDETFQKGVSQPALLFLMFF